MDADGWDEDEWKNQEKEKEEGEEEGTENSLLVQKCHISSLPFLLITDAFLPDLRIYIPFVWLNSLTQCVGTKCLRQ